MADHEELMAKARAVVVQRTAKRRLMREADAEIARRLADRCFPGPRGVEVDDEWAQFMHEFVAAQDRERYAERYLAGIVGGGWASEVWQVPPKSGMEFVRLDGVEVVRVRAGFVSDGELAERPLPVWWRQTRAPCWWLTVRHPWWALRGWWHRKRAVAEKAGVRLVVALIARVLRDAARSGGRR